MSRTSVSSHVTLAEAEALLFKEARLLDSNRLREWSQLFAPEATYELPMLDTKDPLLTPGLLYDTAGTRRKRVDRLFHGPAYSQIPPSRTVRQVTNVEITESDGSGLSIECVVVIHEVRPDVAGRQQFDRERTLAARAEYRLVGGAEELKIAQKVARLISSDVPVDNLTFII